MSIDLNKFPQFQAKKEAFATLVKNSAGQEEQAQAYSNMMNALTEDLSEYINQQVTSRVGELSAEKQPTMSKEEAKFFNDLATGDLSHSESHEVTFPETVVDKIFEDMVQNHPFLQLIKLNNTGLRLKFLKSDAKGAAVWGKITDKIKGQLTGTFSDESAEQSKLTAFVAVPNDVLEYGANWIKTFVMTQIQEAFAVALESAFLTGDGKDKPIGLNRQVQKDVAVAGGVYPEKASSGTLTFKIEAAATMQNVNGQWVYALPFGVKTVESEYVPDGKVIAFVPDRYDAFVAGGVVIKEFDQTLALEDGHLYTAKRFAYGKASDDNVAKVYDLAIDDSTNETTGKGDK